MAEGAGGKNRYRDEPRRSTVPSHEVGAQREFGRVEFLIAQHAPEGLLDAERQIVKLHAFDRHPAVLERSGAIIIPAG
jgi:hypothetical protein